MNNKQIHQEKGTLHSPILLMCPPDFFQIHEPDPSLGHFNDHSVEGWSIFKRDPKGFLEQATQQWFELRNILVNKLQVQLHLLTPSEGLFDQVFTADASISLIDKDRRYSFISSFTHPKRQAETLAHKNLFKHHFLNRELISLPHPFEGSGDNLYDSYRDVYWSGYNHDLSNPAAGRSDIKNHRLIETITGVKIHSLQVKRPFFHIDTSIACLNQGHMLLYKEGINPSSYKTLLKEGFYHIGLNPKEYLIELSKNEAYQYGCNVINIGHQVIIPKCGDDLPKKIQEAGYEVFEVDLSYFIYAGGGPHCLTNYLNHPRRIPTREIRHQHDEHTIYT